jgi:S1-C subfamily serine protease
MSKKHKSASKKIKLTSIFQKVKRATVAIAMVQKEMVNMQLEAPYEIIGSGFCIDPGGIVVTCRHVIDGFMSKSICDQIAEAKSRSSISKKEMIPVSPGKVFVPFALFYDTTASDGQIVVTAIGGGNILALEDYDIAVMYLGTHPRLKQGYPFLGIEDYSIVQEGKDIGICGFPLGNRLYKQLGTLTSSFTKGIVSSIIPSPDVPQKHLRGFQLNATATHGNSGGPVFSIDSGKVFGILSSGPTSGSGNALPGIVKAEPIYPALEAKVIGRVKKINELMANLRKQL